MAERRLGRTLSDQERVTLVQRLDAVGPERLADVVLDVPEGELAAWLNDPSAS